MTVLVLNLCYNEVYYKGITLYYDCQGIQQKIKIMHQVSCFNDGFMHMAGLIQASLHKIQGLFKDI